jgi:hypothetical protein
MLRGSLFFVLGGFQVFFAFPLGDLGSPGILESAAGNSLV